MSDIGGILWPLAAERNGDRDCSRSLGWEVPEPQRVLYVDGEMDPAEMRDKRLKRMRKSMPPEAQERLRENLFFLSHHAFPETGIPDLSDADKPGTSWLRKRQS